MKIYNNLLTRLAHVATVSALGYAALRNFDIDGYQEILASSIGGFSFAGARAITYYSDIPKNELHLSEKKIRKKRLEFWSKDFPIDLFLTGASYLFPPLGVAYLSISPIDARRKKKDLEALYVTQRKRKKRKKKQKQEQNKEKEYEVNTPDDIDAMFTGYKDVATIKGKPKILEDGIQVYSDNNLEDVLEEY